MVYWLQNNTGQVFWIFAIWFFNLWRPIYNFQFLKMPSPLCGAQFWNRPLLKIFNAIFIHLQFFFVKFDCIFEFLTLENGTIPVFISFLAVELWVLLQYVFFAHREQCHLVIHSKANNSAAPWWISIMFFFQTILHVSAPYIKKWGIFVTLGYTIAISCWIIMIWPRNELFILRFNKFLLLSPKFQGGCKCLFCPPCGCPCPRHMC